MESTVAGRNVGKNDPIRIIDLLSPLILGNKTITRNGRNQLNISCDDRQSANSLTTSRDLIQTGFKVFVPDSFLRKKGFTNSFPFSRSVKDIVRLCSKEDLASIVSIKRVVDDENTIFDKVEFIFDGPTVPRIIRVGDFIIPITLSIPRPRRCYRCQRFCHTIDQCRSSYPSCELCAGRHSSIMCPREAQRRKCKNCNGDHPATLITCPIYKMEFGILKHKYITNCDRAEVKLLFFAGNPDLYQDIDQRPDDSMNVPLHSDVNDAPNNPPTGQSTLIAHSSDGNTSRKDPC